jgi:hypothetical protein
MNLLPLDGWMIEWKPIYATPGHDDIRAEVWPATLDRPCGERTASTGMCYGTRHTLTRRQNIQIALVDMARIISTGISWDAAVREFAKIDGVKQALDLYERRSH